jgi:peptide/nickel transport system substrate-binding protein
MGHSSACQGGTPILGDGLRRAPGRRWSTRSTRGQQTSTAWVQRGRTTLGTQSKRAGWRVVLAIVLALGLVAAACSSGDGGGETSGGTSGPGSASDVDPNGTIRIAYPLTQSGLPAWHDPTTGTNGTSANDVFFYLVYGRFFRPTEEGGLEPDLAEKAEVVDTKTIEITLKSGLTFSDGTPFDANAVKAGLDRNIASKNEDAFLKPFFSLTAVEVVSPTVVRLSIPDGTAASWYDAYLGSWQTTIVKPGETNFDEPIGAGPMTVESYDIEKAFVLKKSPSYWGADEIKVAGMDFVNMPFAQPEAPLNALRADQVDLAFADASQVTSLTGNLKPYSLTNPNQVIWMHMCKSSGPLADPRVRKAINKGIDRESINEAVYFGTAEPSTEMWPSGHRFNDPEAEDTLAYDQDEAKALLQEAGYGNGVSIDIYPLPFAGITETTQIMKDQLAKIGITLNIQPSTDYVNNYLVPSPPAIGVYPGNAVGPAKLTAWTGTGIGNVCKYDDPELTAIYNQLNTVSANSDEAQQLWYQAEDLVTDEALGGFVVFRSIVSAYDDETLGDMSAWPLNQYVVPLPWQTYVKASS